MTASDDLLASIERSFTQAAATMDRDERLSLARTQMAELHRWGKASPDLAILFSNALAQAIPELGVEGRLACVCLGQALLGAAEALGAEPLFEYGCEWVENFDDEGNLRDDLEATFQFQEGRLSGAAGPALSPATMLAMRSYSGLLHNDWCNFGSWEQIQSESGFEALAIAFRPIQHLRAGKSQYFHYQADLSCLHAALAALRLASTQAELQAAIPAAPGAAPARL